MNMKKIYSVVAMALLAMGVNAQVTYDFTTVAPQPADGGGIVKPKYGEGNGTDSEWAFTIHSSTDDADIPMVYLVASDGTDYGKRVGIHNRARAGCSATPRTAFGEDCGHSTATGTLH